MPSDSCKTELNSAPSIRSTVAYQYYLLCIPFPPVQNRRTAEPHRGWEGEMGKACGEQLLRSNGQRKRATCFALLQNKLKSDVAHFTIQESNLSRNISGRVNTDFWLDKKYTGPTSYTGVASLAAKQVCLEPVKRATCAHCCKTRSYYLLFARPFRNLKQTHLLQDRFDSWVVTCATSLFTSLCNNEAKQVARFCCLFHRTFTTEITTLLAIKRN